MIRSQLTSLNADIHQRAAFIDLGNAISGTSNNSVSTPHQSAYARYSQTQMQDVLNKLDVLVNALRR